MFVSPPPVPLATIKRDDARNRTCAASHLRAALNGISAGLLTFDEKLEIQFTNDRLATMLDIHPRAARDAASLLSLLEGSVALDEAAVQRSHAACSAAVSTSEEQRVTLSVLSGQQSRFFTLHVAQLDGGHWMASFDDVSSRHAAEASAVELAMHDSLTGLPNRELFHKRVTAALAEAAQDADQGDRVALDKAGLAVMLIDLDRFKAVNDTLGRPVGDGMLCLVSKRLRSVLRSHDVLARLGGDEFALMVFSGPEPGSLVKLANRIVDVLGRTYLLKGHPVNISASVGVALAPHDGRDYDQLLRSAHLALHDAKNSGRGTHRFFNTVMGDQALARRSLEIDLRKALALREFELHYQPQIDLESNSVLGFEALLRWHHPERGLVSPADFIPLAEEIGLIVPIGEWVLRQACHDALRWPEEVSVAVNVSPNQFVDAARLVDMVAKALASSGLPG